MDKLNINLDCMGEDELREIELIFDAVSRIAFFKRWAIKHRENGSIMFAQNNEILAEEEYQKLPGWAKW